MGINTRCFIISISAIFLALGIGIFIGFMFDAQAILAAEREDIVAKLEEKFQLLEEENKKNKEMIASINNENEKYKEFYELSFPKLISNRLRNIKVAIINTNNNYNCSDINSLLEIAGAEIISITTINNNIENNPESFNMKYLYTEIGSDDIQILEYIANNIINNVINGESSEAFQELIKMNVINIEGQYNEDIDCFILTGDLNHKKGIIYQILDNNIIEYLNKKDYCIIGIAQEGSKYSHTDYFKKKNIPVIDSINTIMGKASLIFTLEERLFKH